MSVLVIEASVIAGYVIAWVLRKAKRAGDRLDTEADAVMDAGLDKLHEVVATKLGAHPVLDEAQDEGQVSELTRQQVELAITAAARKDDAFGQAVTDLVAQLRAAEQAGGRSVVAGAGARVFTGDADARARDSGIAFGQIGGDASGAMSCWACSPTQTRPSWRHRRAHPRARRIRGRLDSPAEQSVVTDAIPGARLGLDPNTGRCPNWERPGPAAADIYAFVHRTAKGNGHRSPERSCRPPTRDSAAIAGCSWFSAGRWCLPRVESVLAAVGRAQVEGSRSRHLLVWINAVAEPRRDASPRSSSGKNGGLSCEYRTLTYSMRTVGSTAGCSIVRRHEACDGRAEHQ